MRLIAILVLIAGLAAAPPAQASDEYGLVAGTVGTTTLRGSFSHTPQPGETVEFEFGETTLPSFEMLFASPDFLIRSRWQFGDLFAVSHFTRQTSGAPVAQDGEELGRLTYSKNITWVIPALEVAKLWRLGPGSAGVGGLFDAVGMTDGFRSTNPKALYGFNLGAELVALVPIPALRTSVIAAGWGSLLAFVHPSRASGRQLGARVDLFVGAYEAYGVFVGVSHELSTYHADDDPEMEISVTVIRIGFAGGMLGAP